MEEKTAQKINYVMAEFENDGKVYSFALSKENGVFKKTHSIANHMRNGRWNLNKIYCYGDSSGIQLSLRELDIWFEVIGGDALAPEITSVTMDKKNGDILKVGDKVTFEIKASDEALDTERFAYLVLKGFKDRLIHIDLEYDESKGVFIGTYIVLDTTYPCEWYLSNVTIRDLYGNETSIDEYFDKTGEEFYFNVENEGYFASSTYDVNVYFHQLNEYGYFERTKSWEKKDIEKGTTLKKLGLVLPKAPIPFEGLEFIEWVEKDGTPFTGDTPVIRDDSIYVYPKYNKSIVRVAHQYPTKDLNKIDTISEILLLDPDTTYREVIEEASKKTVDNMWKEQDFYWKWLESTENENPVLDETLPNHGDVGIVLKAVYDGYKVVPTEPFYIGKDTMLGDNYHIEMVKEGTTYEKFKEDIIKSVEPDMFEGLRVKSWDITFDGTSELAEGVIIDDYEGVDITATYENHLVRFYVSEEYEEVVDSINNIDEESDTSRKGGESSNYLLKHAVAADKGDIIKMPEIPGYKEITWVHPKDIGNEFEVTGDMNIYGYGKMDNFGPGEDTDPDKPTEPEKPVVPDTPSTEGPNTGAPGETTKPETPTVTNRPSAEVIEKVVSNITEAKEGETVEVNMGDATVLPVDFLASARGKNVTIKLVMNGYTWSINGQDIVASSLKDINMEVTMDSNAVPSHVVKSLAGDHPIKQLSLTHNGDFGFGADLTINVGNEHQGKYGNLYYYDSDGKMVFMNAGTINDKGEVSLSFSHASDYVVVINDNIMDNNDTDVPESGDTMNHMLWTTSMMASLVVVGMMYNKKRQFIK